MESIPECPFFDFTPDTLQNIRKLCGLDTPQMVEESIDRLQEWIQKQIYFKKKDFDRDFLEKLIVGSHGSVERAKKRLDKICTLRTLVPSYFVLDKLEEITEFELCIDIGLPKLTKDYHRLYVMRGYKGSYTSSMLRSYLRRIAIYFDYWLKYDYCLGVVGILDTRDVEMKSLLQLVASPEARNEISLLFGCFPGRIHSIHFLINSKFINTVFSLIKLMYSPKLYERCHFHNSLESLHEFVDKRILPKEYGGEEEPLIEMHNKVKSILSSGEYLDSIKGMQNATIDTDLKSIEDVSEKYNLGLAGTFRQLNFYYLPATLYYVRSVNKTEHVIEWLGGDTSWGFESYNDKSLVYLRIHRNRLPITTACVASFLYTRTLLADGLYSYTGQCGQYKRARADMLALKESPLIVHNPDTLEVIRKEFNLHQPGRMDESIDRLHEWIQAQPHFNKKDFSREYLEIFIINSRGSVERTKEFMEKLCAYKTFGPQYFNYSTKPIDLSGLEDLDSFCLPRLTKENYRIFLVRNTVQKHYTHKVILNYLTKTFCMLEYLMEHSYSLGARLVLDYRNTDIAYLIAALKYPDARNGFLPFFKGYAQRLKSLHIISTSKVVDIFISAVGQIVSLKMLGRIYVHANIEELYEYVDRDLMPSEYGGKEKSTKELKDDWDKVLSTDEFMSHIRDMFQATIDPSKKPVDKFNDLFLGMPGTFRTLSID